VNITGHEQNVPRLSIISSAKEGGVGRSFITWENQQGCGGRRERPFLKTEELGIAKGSWGEEKLW
jgi:hypothetical protein